MKLKTILKKVNPARVNFSKCDQFRGSIKIGDVTFHLDVLEAALIAHSRNMFPEVVNSLEKVIACLEKVIACLETAGTKCPAVRRLIESHKEVLKAACETPLA